MTSKQSISRNSNPKPSQSSSQAQRLPSVRVKTRSTRLCYGIDKTIPGVQGENADSQPFRSKGVTINEERTKKRHDPESIPQGRGKEPQYSVPHRPKQPFKRKKTTEHSVPAAGQTSSHNPHTQGQSAPQVSQSIPAILDIYNHTRIPKGFSEEPCRMTSEEGEKFRAKFADRAFCPIVSVDLEKLKEDCNLDLSPWLKQFESLISIKAAYSPKLVKVFYFHMQSDNLVDEDGNLVEERITTKVRGQKITISPSYLNSILQIPHPPSPSDYRFDQPTTFALLRPNEPVPEGLEILNFTPASMPPRNRAIWYIYTRNLLQKGGNFTHFAKKDFPLFASILAKKPHNVGHWLFHEMSRFAFSSRQTSQIPFPSLVSVILFHEKIWYLPANEQPIKPQEFGRHIMNLMGLNPEEKSDQSRAPPRPRATRSRGTYSRAQEAQSAPPPQTSLPADFDSRIKDIVNQAISDLTDKIEAAVGQMVSEVTQGHNNLVDTQEGFRVEQEVMKTQLIDHSTTMSALMVTVMTLSAKMDQMLHNQTMAASTSGTPSAHPIPVTQPSIVQPEPSHDDPPLFADDKGGRRDRREPGPEPEPELEWTDVYFCIEMCLSVFAFETLHVDDQFYIFTCFFCCCSD